jgi:hypothetical protein
MKTRQGFVSNSSSASFVIAKSLLTEAQLKGLMDYQYSPANVDGWSVTDNGEYIDGMTIMDNDSIDELFERLQIPPNHIRFTSDG